MAYLVRMVGRSDLRLREGTLAQSDNGELRHTIEVDTADPHARLNALRVAQVRMAQLLADVDEHMVRIFYQALVERLAHVEADLCGALDLDEELKRVIKRLNEYKCLCVDRTNLQVSIVRALSMRHPSGGQWLVVHVHHRLERMGDVGGIEGTVEDVGLHHGAGSQSRRHAEHHMAARVPRPDDGRSSQQDESLEELLLNSIFSVVFDRKCA
jgi:hypothetical protein